MDILQVVHLYSQKPAIGATYARNDYWGCTEKEALFPYVELLIVLSWTVSRCTGFELLSKMYIQLVFFLLASSFPHVFSSSCHRG